MYIPDCSLNVVGFLSVLAALPFPFLQLLLGTFITTVISDYAAVHDLFGNR